jgi:hypothetical protein
MPIQDTRTPETRDLTTGVAPDATLGTTPAAAAERVAAELAALPETDIVMPNVDVSASSGLALSAWSSFAPYLPEIARMAHVDVALIQKIPDYAWALKFWNSATLYEAAPSPALTALADRGYAIRQRLLDDLEALAGHGFLEATLLSKFAGTTSHQKLSDDLLGLAKLVPERWDVILGRSAITLEAVAEASDVGAKLAVAVGGRDRTPGAIAHAQAQRLRAYTLFMRAYDEARRAISFLRWHEGDDDKILPSLFATKKTPRRRQEAEASTADVPVAPTSESRSSSLLVTPSPKASSSEPFVG